MVDTGAEMRTVYIMLMRSRTAVSSLIYRITGAQYTHSSIGFENDGLEFYSFARRNPDLPLPAGLITERLGKGMLARCTGAPCALYSLEIPEEAFQKIQRELMPMLAEKEKWKYSIVGLLLCRLKWEAEIKHQMFCSQFVSTMLKTCGAVALTKAPSLYHPIELAGIEGVHKLYEGTVGGLSDYLESRSALRMTAAC